MANDTLTSNPVQTLLNEKFAHIYFDPTTSIIYVKWIGFLRLEDVKRGCTIMIDFMRDNKLTLNLNDQTEMKVLSKEVQDFLLGEIFPQLEQIGLRKIGVLVAEDVFAQATVSNVNSKATMGGLSIGTFGSKTACTTWLLE